MSFTILWKKNREQKKLNKKTQTDILLSKYSNSNDFVKLHDLTELYLDCFDLMTKIGIEISKIADKEQKEGC